MSAPSSPPESSVPPFRRVLRPAAALVVAFGLLLGACSSGSKAAPREASEETTTSVTSNNLAWVSSFATAKKPTLTVYTNLPNGVTTTTAASSSTTSTTIKSTMPAIPRTGLNSAGVKKTNDGIEFTNPTYFKNPLVVEVLANQGDWLRVLVTARPNHTEGWVKADDVILGATDFRMELDLSTFTLRVYKAADLYLETKVAIGRDSTPMPVGKFFMTEIIKNSSDTGIYGAYILPTNGYVRMANEAVTKIAQNVPPGTPIQIFATTPASWTGTASSTTVAAKP